MICDNLCNDNGCQQYYVPASQRHNIITAAVTTTCLSNMHYIANTILSSIDMHLQLSPLDSHCRRVKKISFHIPILVGEIQFSQVVANTLFRHSECHRTYFL